MLSADRIYRALFRRNVLRLGVLMRLPQPGVEQRQISFLITSSQFAENFRA